MHSMNKIDENIAKIATLFPNCVTEAKGENGEITHKIDFDMLKQELSHSLVEGREERYQFTWPNKRQAILTANAPINKTLRPCREESVNFDETENLYIEGDNLEVLKLLQETYLGKIKMIYIDPPYNTGNDFVYNDDFSQDADDYMSNSGQTDEDGNRLVANTESNGRFHTDWLNMIYPRLKLARDLLSDDGVIFISINDKEIDNLKSICTEIFGLSNYIATLVWDKSVSAQAGIYKMYHEYILVVAKNIENIGVPKSITHDEFEAAAVKKISGRHPASQFTFPKGTRFDAPDGTILEGELGDTIKIKIINGKMISKNGNLAEDVTVEAGFTQAKQMYQYFYGKRDELVDSNGQKILEFFLNSTGKVQVKKIRSVESPQSTCNFGTQAAATQELVDLFELNEPPFSSPKPTKMIQDFILRFTNKDSLILDFFSGSGTTAQAVFKSNLHDGGKRKFILVQIQEDLDEALRVAQKDAVNPLKVAIEYLQNHNKPHLLTEIGKERIRRAGKQLLQNTKQMTGGGMENSLFENSLTTSAKTPLGVSNPCDNKKLDIGFRVLKCDTTNMEDVYYTPDHIDTNDLFKNNIKSDRTGEDLLFQTMLDLGILLSSKIETKKINGKEVFCVEGNYLMACFDDSVDEATITEIAKEKPYYFVMRDPANSKDGDSLITNFEQIFATYSPDTVRKVL